jgi:hypothetical protein
MSSSDILNWIPVVSQLKSLGHAMLGDMESATATQVAFTKRCPIVAQLRSAVEASIYGDCEAAANTQHEFIAHLGDIAIVTATVTAGVLVAAGAVAAAASSESDADTLTHLKHSHPLIYDDVIRGGAARTREVTKRFTDDKQGLNRAVHASPYKPLTPETCVEVIATKAKYGMGY